jgi:hypothetical protein
LSPLKNRVGVGVESYVVFAADGENGEGDLYAGSARGGGAFRVTFTRVHETAPALSPDGIMLAFIRGPHAADSAGHRVWVMNLLNGAERELSAFGPGVYPRRLGWSLDGSSLFVRTSRGDFRVTAPPADPEFHAVSPTEKATADTLLAVPLGFPVVGVAADCDSGICAFTPSGSQVLTGTGRAAFRWGADSVAYFAGDEIEVRPLGGGTTRQLRWSGVPGRLRTATQFPGVGPTDRDR